MPPPPSMHYTIGNPPIFSHSIQISVIRFRSEIDWPPYRTLSLSPFVRSTRPWRTQRSDPADLNASERHARLSSAGRCVCLCTRTQIQLARSSIGGPHCLYCGTTTTHVCTTGALVTRAHLCGDAAFGNSPATLRLDRGPVRTVGNPLVFIHSVSITRSGS